MHLFEETSMLPRRLHLVLLPVWTIASAQLPPETKDRAPFFVEYHHGGLEVEIAGYPLHDVLRELQKRTGMRVLRSNELQLKQPVWVIIRGATLEQGVRRLLGDLSYVLVENGGQYTLYLLPQAAGASGGVPDPVSRGPEKSSAGQAAGQASPTNNSYEQTLRSLRSAADPLQAEAIDRLAEVQDPRILETLKQAASGELPLVPSARVQAVSALAQKALNGDEDETDALSALHELADSPEMNVRTIARAAIQELATRKQP
jgi:hypothetical protein